MKVHISGFWALILLASMFVTQQSRAAETAAVATQIKDYWVFYQNTVASPASLQKAISLMKQAKTAGYTGIMVSDSKLEKFQMQEKGYTQNWQKLRQACTEQKMQLIVPVCSMGYMSEFMAEDPNLAEGMPVRGAPLVVKAGKLAPCETAKLVNGSLAEWKGDVPVGWTVDQPGSLSFRDEQVKCGGRPTLRQQFGQAKTPVRLNQKIQVKPWQSYHLSVMVKTEDCTSKDFRVMALGGGEKGRVLDWQPPAIQETMDWTKLDFTFDSLDNSNVTIYCGSWGPKGGKIWWSDVQIEPAGWVNVIRRASLPLSLTSEDGKTIYDEGKDFAEVKDPLLGNDPRPGYFTNWHEVPTVAIPAGSRLKEGQTVLASYHFATTVGKSIQINACLSEPAVFEHVEQIAHYVCENIKPDVFFLGYDEIRHCGWDDSCTKRNMTCGQILADNVHKVYNIVRKTAPDKTIATWNDMFDPFHLARKDGTMYLAKGEGPWYGSWEGLPTDVLIVNWKQNSADSLKFFADRGQSQILAGYYDKDPARIVEWLKLAAQVKGVRGVMYTTWKHDFSKLDAFIKNVKKFEETQKK